MHDDLQRRLRDELDTGIGSRPPSDLDGALRRGRRKRTGLALATTVSMILVGAAVLAGGVWIGQSISSSTRGEQPSVRAANGQTDTPDPALSEAPENAEGTGHIGLLDGQVTLRAGEGWKEHQQWRFISDSPMGPETLLGHEQRPAAALLVITDPAPLEPSCPLTTSPSGTDAEMFVDAIRSHSGLSSSEPVTDQIGGLDALRLDITPLEGASMRCRPGESAARFPLSIVTPPSTNFGVPVITGSRETAFGPSLTYLIETGQKMRLYLLDLPRGFAEGLAIAIIANDENFDAAVDVAQPILDSFGFDAP